ncbi:MAG: TIGR02206 family membrane protein, partial [Oscillospiraceae bacterium]|nr:TIGR02206 family membrane protein [Oscillospiraceae bacterium]
RCFAILAALAAAVYVFDRVFSANYMFLLSPAAGSPLEWFSLFLGIPGYLLAYIPMLALLWALLYLPFRRKR